MTQGLFPLLHPKEVLVERLEAKKKLASPTRYERVTFALRAPLIADTKVGRSFRRHWF